ncbi:MAG: hypothetical protein JWP49_1990 [Phenylobacterium sp.]|nr:hypothetical protein [Phenylobacterium sp.]
MSLKIGGSHSSSSATSNTNTNSTNNSNTANAFNSTTTPTVPEWASSLTQNIASRVGDVNSLDPQSLVAGANPLQSQAATVAGGLSGSPWNFDGAADETRYVMGANAPHTGAAQASPYIQQYMDPYLGGVVNAADADLSANEGKVRAQQALDLAGSGAFGGSGAALTQSMTEGELARARASTLSGLRSQGFSQALGAAQQDAQRAQGAKDLNAQLYGQQMDRALGAARQLGDLSTSYDANQRANIATQAQLGGALRDVNQQQLQAPVTNTQQIVAMLSGLPIQLFTGQEQSGTQTGANTSNTVGSSNTKETGQKTEVNAEATFPPIHFP